MYECVIVNNKLTSLLTVLKQECREDHSCLIHCKMTRAMRVITSKSMVIENIEAAHLSIQRLPPRIARIVTTSKRGAVEEDNEDADGEEEEEEDHGQTRRNSKAAGRSNYGRERMHNLRFLRGNAKNNTAYDSNRDMYEDLATSKVTTLSPAVHMARKQIQACTF